MRKCLTTSPWAFSGNVLSLLGTRFLAAKQLRLLLEVVRAFVASFDHGGDTESDRIGHAREKHDGLEDLNSAFDNLKTGRKSNVSMHFCAGSPRTGIFRDELN